MDAVPNCGSNEMVNKAHNGIVVVKNGILTSLSIYNLYNLLNH